ncbi:MAG: DUF3413 domain-containing protein [Deltaproteobacteria bacterium]|nr:DUF3413 domain-containing protein [Deltaproteobacteria bacterium]
MAQVALNLPLVGLILMRNLKGADTGILPAIYNTGTIIGCYLLPVLLGCSLLTVPLMNKRRLARGICVVLLSGYVFFLLIDSLVFSIYKFHIDFFWLSFLVHDYSGLGIPFEAALAAGFMLAMILLLEWKLSLLAGGSLEPVAAALVGFSCDGGAWFGEQPGDTCFRLREGGFADHSHHAAVAFLFAAAFPQVRGQARRPLRCKPTHGRSRI